MKIRLVGAELFHVDKERDRRIDMMELIKALRTLAKAFMLCSIELILVGNMHWCWSKEVEYGFVIL